MHLAIAIYNLRLSFIALLDDVQHVFLYLKRNLLSVDAGAENQLTVPARFDAITLAPRLQDSAQPLLVPNQLIAVIIERVPNQ
jgi:hypothetical protein